MVNYRAKQFVDTVKSALIVAMQKGAPCYVQWRSGTDAAWCVYYTQPISGSFLRCAPTGDVEIVGIRWEEVKAEQDAEMERFVNPDIDLSTVTPADDFDEE